MIKNNIKTVRRKPHKKRQKRKLKIFIWYTLMLTVLSLTAWGYRYFDNYLQTVSGTFELQSIKISGNDILSRAEVLKLLGLPAKGQKLLEINPAEVQKKLKRSPFVRSASAVHSLPATLRIHLVERRPLAFLYGRGLNMVDREGFIMPVPAISRVWDLPVIRNAPGRLGIQGAVSTSPAVHRAVDILDWINRLDAPLPQMISELDFTPGDYIKIYLRDGDTVLRITEKDYQRQLYKAAGFFKDYVDFKKLNQIAYIDLRFGRQIVVKEKTKS